VSPAHSLPIVSNAPDGDRGLDRATRSRRTADLLAEADGCADPARRDALLDEVIVINRGVAESVASRFRNRGVALEDLHQVAYLGLTRAVHRYDPSQAEDLLTYAVPTIRGELQRYFRDHGWAVRPSRRVQELQWRINQAIDRLSQRNGREPDTEELCAHLELSYAEYAEAVAAFGCFQPTSLDRPAAADSTSTVGELLGEAQPVGAVEARVVLQPVIRQLNDRERRILYLRFFEERTQQEIGEELGVTQMQVSRLLKRIFERLRADLAEPRPV
jgi:RNA polymerase sigma-B factor